MSWDRSNVRTPLAEGVVIMIAEAGQQVQCPELAIRQRKQHRHLIRGLAEIRTKAFALAMEPTKASAFIEAQDLQDEIDEICANIVRLALERNYPEVTEEDIDGFSRSQLNKALLVALQGPESAAPGEARGAVSGIASPTPTPN